MRTKSDDHDHPMSATVAANAIHNHCDNNNRNSMHHSPNEGNDHDNNNHDDWKIALYYCYVPIGNQHQVTEHISFQQSICQERQLMGRIRVSSEGVNGVLSGLLHALQEYEHLLRDELQSILQKAHHLNDEHNDDNSDPNNNNNDDDSTSLELDVKYCHLHTHLPVSAQLFDSLSVKATREVVSLFEPLEPDLASHVPNHPDQRNYWRRRRRRRRQQQPGKKQQEDGNDGSDTPKEEDSNVIISTSHGIIPPSILNTFQPAPHLSPRQWHEQLQQASLLSSVDTPNHRSSCHDTVTNHASNSCNDQTNATATTTSVQSATTPTTATTAVLLDARNVYESRVGYFATPHIPTILANTRKYSDLPKVMQEVADQLSGKDVYMYCTGGVRCERASMYLQALSQQSQLWNAELPPPRRIFQLQGGIQRYLEEFGQLEHQTSSSDEPESSNEQQQQKEKEDPLHPIIDTTGDCPSTETTTATATSSLFRGKNFVFDPRRTDPLVSNEVVGRCLLCDKAHDDYDNGAAPCEDQEARCQKCRVLLLVCPTCRRFVQWKHSPIHTNANDNADDDAIQLPPLLCGKDQCVDEGNSVSQIATILIQSDNEINRKVISYDG